jgi:hypothetical protein
MSDPAMEAGYQKWKLVTGGSQGVSHIPKPYIYGSKKWVFDSDI